MPKENKGKKYKYYIENLDTTISTKYDVPSEILIVNEKIPVIPSYMIIVGTGGSGKTLLICNLAHMFKKVFKGRIVIFSGTANKTLLELEKSLGADMYYSILKKDGTDRIQEIIDFQTLQKKNGNKIKNILIILDDYVNDKIMNKPRSSLTTCYSQGRHANITIITGTQKYTKLPTIVRSETDYTMLFPTDDITELKSIVDGNCMWLQPQEFERLFIETTKEPHSFLFLDKKQKVMRKNFGNIVNSKDPIDIKEKNN